MNETTSKTLVCELCEAGCGLQVELSQGAVTAVRGNERDVTSKGFVCPKGLASLALDQDPDRLRTPVQRCADGSFTPISWEQAFDTVAQRLTAIQKAHGRDAVAVYMGTPIVHKHGALLMRAALLSALGTRNATSAGSQDSSPRFAASYFLYGSAFAIPVPDIDRTQFFLCIGANPLVSNGSFLTAPNMRGRLRALQARGGRIVVVDPRRTETAQAADEHVAITPGSDAAFVLAMTQVLLAERRIDEATLERCTRNWLAIRARLRDYTPERVADYTGVPAATIRRLALEFADAQSSAAYARLGVCNHAFGTLGSYAVDLLNLTAGRLGQVGGSLFATPAIDLGRMARLMGSDGYARFRSRVRGLPEIAGDLPAATLAEEMETPGDGQVRAFITYAGNPVLSTPNGQRLARALGKLDFMVSIDFYVNETTRFADIILPPCGPFAEEHVDLFFANAAAHNAIRWTGAAAPRGEDERCDWEIMLELAYRLGGGPSGLRPLDLLLRAARRFGYRYSLQQTVDLALWFGPYRLRGAAVRAAPDGIDLGPLQAGFERRVFHPDGRIELGTPAILSAFAQQAQALAHPRPVDELLLIGRRDLRSNNSWMHNLPKLVSGRARCVLLVHPDDARRAGVRDGEQAWLESKVHCAQVPVQLSDEMRPGVVSLPHGFGHAGIARFQRVAGEHAGVSANDWTDDQEVEAIVGQSILNGVKVRLRAVVPTAARDASS